MGQFSKRYEPSANLISYSALYCYYLELYIKAVMEGDKERWINYLKEKKETAFRCYVKAICKEFTK